MVIVNKAILHILDFNSGITVFSQENLDITDAFVNDFLSRHIEKCLKDSSAMNGRLLNNSDFPQLLEEYNENPDKFIDFSLTIANKINNCIQQTDNDRCVDFIFCDFSFDNNKYIGLLLYDNQNAYTHKITNNGDKIKNEIINYFAILPSPSQKVSAFAIIDTDKYEVKVFDKKYKLNGEIVQILKDFVVICDVVASPKDTVKIVKKVIDKIADENGENNIVAVSKAKSYIADVAEISEEIDTIELSQKVFSSSPILQNKFQDSIKEAGIPEVISIDKNFAIKATKSHKIKTDTGIEISIPSDFFNNTDYIEFINNPDGTISISIKNIGKIINK